MKKFFALWIGLACGLVPAAAAPVDASARTRVATANTHSTLDRQSGLVTSSVDVSITNIGDRILESPLQAAVFFTAGSGVLDGLRVPGASGGIGQAPYQTFFFDLSAAVGAGLAPQATTSFNLRFTPAKGARLGFRIVPFAVVNGDPVPHAGGPYAGQRNQDIAFSSAGSIDPDNDPITFTWDFGDGSPTVAQAAPPHRYAAPGAYEAILTVRDNRGGIATARVPVAISPSQSFALARVRTLDGSGLPLGGVDVSESLSANVVAFKSDRSSGFAALGRGPGDYVWKFSKSGHLDVWRKTALGAGNVSIIASPWLAEKNATAVHVSPIGEARLISSSVTLDFPAGAFPQPTDATLTELSPQTLPYPLPAGWSPLVQFHLGLTGEPSQPGSAALKLRGPVAPGENAILAKFNPILFKWEVLALAAGNGTNTAVADIGSSGAFALAVRDTGPTAPPVADVGGTLEGATGPVDTSGATAIGTVTPATSPASRDPALVTATARVTFSNSTPVPSGTLFVTAVSEKYELNGGGSAAIPDYDTTIFAYQRPGNVLAAEFPMRPQLLFGAEELKEATVRADVLNAQAFAGGVVDNSGGQLGKDGVHVVVPADGFTGPQPAEIATRDPQTFVSLTGGVVPQKAFTLNFGTLAPGKVLGFAFDGLEPNANFVLGIVVSDGASRGVTPLERFVTDATGRLTSTEPSTGPRLPGANGAGDYVLIKLAGPLALVEGIARDAAGNPAAGLAVRTSGQPWLVFSAADGSYKTLAGVGTVLVTAIDPRDGNEGSLSVVIDDPGQSKHADLSTTPTPPRVASVDPAANATGVRRVTPITVTFTEPITSASFGADGVVLRDASNNVVPAALTLNRIGTVATLLPANPLDAGAQFHIEVSAAIKDTTGLVLSGDRIFAFNTAAEGPRAAGAQLVVYEPGAANVPADVLSQLVGYTPGDRSKVIATGSAGTADPNVAVILGNEIAGTTATVLSNADGSFATFLEAAEDERVSATFVNANRTRITVPATRQLFDDGRVGLYSTGGILEAQSDGGPVQVIVKPGSIPERTVFKVTALDLATILTLLGGVQPGDDGKVLGGLHVEAQGDPLKQSVKVSVPVDPNSTGLPPGTDPAEGVYALTRMIEVDGVKVFEILDKMEFADGKLSTASPPFFGYLASSQNDDIFAVLESVRRQGGKAVVTGHATARQHGIAGTDKGFSVPGAVVYVDALAAVNAGSPPAPLAAGRFVAVADADGAFRLLTPVPLLFTGAVALGAVSNRFPGVPGFGTAQQASFAATTLLMEGDAYFDTTTPILTFSGLDTSPPKITFAEPIHPNIGQSIPLRFLATDNAATPTLNVQLVSIDPLPTEPPIQPTQYTFSAGPPISTGLTTRLTATLTSQRGAFVTLRATASDGQGNSVTSDHLFMVQDNQGIFDFTQGPYVLESFPQDGAQDVDRFMPIRVVFNEPINVSVPSDLVTGLKLTPSAGQPYISYSEDRTEFSLFFPSLTSDTQYTLDVAPAFIRDDANNPLDQDNIPDGFLSHYTAQFTTKHEGSGAVQVQNGGGVVEKDDYYYYIDRGLGGLLKVLRKKPTDTAAQLVTTKTLLDFPRDIILIPKYTYRVPGASPPEIRHDRDLIVITGGLTGGATDVGFENLGPWLQIFDVTNPENPTGVALKIISDSPSAAFVKLDWSPPILGILEIGDTDTAIHYVNLPLFIWANHRAHTPAMDQFPHGFHGVDLNGDGDYADPGETFPSPDPDQPIVGLINGGLVATFLPTPGIGRFTDFNVQFGGDFLGVTGGGTVGLPGYYQTLVDGGVLLTGNAGANAIQSIIGSPKRVLTLFGVPLEAVTGGARPANLALVSEGTNLLVIDITDVQHPTLIATLDLTQVNSAFGFAQSAILRSDGLIALSCTGGQVILDPKRLALPAQSGAKPAAVLGVRSGVGSNVRAFVSDGDRFAINNGGNALLSADLVADVPLTVTGIFAEDINSPKPLPAFPPPNFVNPPPVIRKSMLDPKINMQLIEVTDSVVPGKDPTLRLTATIQPGAAAFQPVYPTWKLDGAEVAHGPRVEIHLPGFQNPGIFPSVLFSLSPQEHTITCEQHSLRVHVYPDPINGFGVDLSKLTEKLNEATKAVEEVVKDVSPPGLVSGEFKISFPLTATFGFSNQWKECDVLTFPSTSGGAPTANPYSNLAFCTFDAEAGFDPLIGISGKVKIGPTFSVISLGVFVEAYGQLSLKGKLSRDQCGNPGGTVGLTGKFGLKAGVELDVKVLQATLSADAPVSVKATVFATTQPVDPKFKVSSKFEANFDGITGKLSVKTAGGIVSFPTTVTIVGPHPLIQSVETQLLP